MHAGRDPTDQGNDLVELSGSGSRATLDESTNDLGPESEHRQEMPQDVMDVMPEHLSLGDEGELTLSGCSALLKFQRDTGDGDGNLGERYAQYLLVRLRVHVP